MRRTQLSSFGMLGPRTPHFQARTILPWRLRAPLWPACSSTMTPRSRTSRSGRRACSSSRRGCSPSRYPWGRPHGQELVGRRRLGVQGLPRELRCQRVADRFALIMSPAVDFDIPRAYSFAQYCKSVRSWLTTRSFPHVVRNFEAASGPSSSSRRASALIPGVASPDALPKPSTSAMERIKAAVHRNREVLLSTRAMARPRASGTCRRSTCWPLSSGSTRSAF